MVHGGCAITTPQPFKVTITDSCNDGIVASQFDVAIVLLYDLCLTVEGLSVVIGDKFVSFHDAVPFLCCLSVVLVLFVGWLFLCWLFVRSLVMFGNVFRLSAL